MGTTHDADVIIIGAGIAGMTTAAYLAAAGKRVLVVDPGTRPGGNSTVFERGGFEFDIGLHYIGSGMDGRPILDPMLAPLGIDLQWNRLDHPDTIVLPDGQVFEVPVGAQAYAEALHAALPAEAVAVDRFVAALLATDRQLDTLATASGITGLPAILRSAVPLLRHGRAPLRDLFDELHCSAKARMLMGWIAGVYGLPPSRTPFAVHALATMLYLRGAWYPAGGGSVVADSLAEVVAAGGGRILLQHRAAGISVVDGRAVGVAATGPDGPVHLQAPAVVSCADIKHTYLELLDPRSVPTALRRKVRGYEMSLPLAVLYGVIDRDLRAEGVPVTNYLIAGDDIEAVGSDALAGRFSERPVVWLTSASLKDPSNGRLCGPGRSNVQLMGLVPPQPAAWGLQVGVERGEAYAAAKRALRDRMVAAADRAIPGLGEALVFEEVATPYTFTRYTGTTDGTSYGIALTADQLVQNRPGPKTHIKGLFLAGASTRAGHGISGGMAGGIAAASEVLRTPAVDAVRRRTRAVAR